MFLLRAAFWLAAVVVLMPREPDLGISAQPEVAPCGQSAVCDEVFDATAWLSQFRAAALTSLARVREDLEASRRG
jgi:hypothetical protein